MNKRDKTSKTRNFKLRRSALASCAILLSMPAFAVRAADAWQPTRPVQIIAPAAPGGGHDLAARTLQSVIEQDKLSPKPVTVINRPGGGDSVGIAYMNSHPGDGNYVCVQALALITNKITGLSKLSLDDVTPIGLLMTEPVVFAVAADGPIKSGKDLIDMLHKDPSSVSVAVASGPGTQSHDAMALVLKAAGEDPKKLKLVFFDSGGEAVTSLMGGHVTVAVGPAGPVLGPAKAGRIRLIGITSDVRPPGDLASVPTWKEQGIDVEFSTWRVLVGPKGMSAAQVAWWDKVLQTATASPEWAAAVRRNIWTANYKNSTQVKAFLNGEQARLNELLTELDLAK